LLLPCCRLAAALLLPCRCCQTSVMLLPYCRHASAMLLP
jgi:hypothetical protein